MRFRTHIKTMVGISLAAGLIGVSACSTTTDPSQGDGEPSTTVTQTAPSLVEGTVIATGVFEGQSDHETSGGVSIIESAGKYFVQLAEDFSLDGAPDPKVGLGKDGYDPSTKAGALVALTGASSYELSETVNVADYNEVFIWCEKFDVPLGVAKLKR